MPDQLIDATNSVTQPDGWRECVPIGIAVHHSGASFFPGDNATQQDEINHIRMIDTYHVSKAYGGFAYHAAVFPSGRRYLTGNPDRARAHVWGRNHELRGAVLIGDFSRVAPSPVLLRAAALTIANLQPPHNVPVKGHREWALAGQGTACPGDTWRTWLPALTTSEEEDDMNDEDRRMLKAVHDWLFDPGTFADPLGRPEWVGATRAQWLDAFGGSMDGLHHFDQTACDTPGSAFHRIAIATGAAK